MKNKKSLLKYLYFALVVILINSLSPNIFGEYNERSENRSGRAGEITINSLEIKGDPNVNGVFSNTPHVLGISFTLAENILNVNTSVAIDNANQTYTDNNDTGNGDLQNGRHNSQLGLNFQEEGWYEITVIIEGWSTIAGSMVNDQIIRYIEFRNIVQFSLNYEIYGIGDDNGVYSKSTTSLNCIINNTGNIPASNYQLKLEIEDSNQNDQTIDGDTVDIDYLDTVDQPILNNFRWTPTHEDTFQVTFTISNDFLTRPNATTNSTTFQIIIQNISAVELNISETEPPNVFAGYEFALSVFVENTGNSLLQAELVLSYYPSNNPGDSTHINTTDRNIPPISMSGHPIELSYKGIVIEEEGEYVIEMEETTTGTVNTSTIYVDSFPNQPPALNNITHMPYDSITAGDTVTFNLNYSDIDNDQGIVNIIIDGVQHQMEPQGNQWNDIVNFQFQWIATWDEESDPYHIGQEHYYSFYTEDDQGNGRNYTNNGLNYSLLVLPPDDGSISGKVIDQEGMPVEGATIVIYDGGNYYNITSDSSGFYSINLPMKDYIAKLDWDWIVENGYEDGYPQGYPSQRMIKLELNLDTFPITQNFIIIKKTIPSPAQLNGSVNDTVGNYLEGVSIELIVFVDEKDSMMVDITIAGVVKKSLINVTNRTWYNLTAVTDDEGKFYFLDIPLSNTEIEAYPQTGLKTYREDREDLPQSATTGYWKIHAELEEYEYGYGTFSRKGSHDTVINRTIYDPAATSVFFKKEFTSTALITLEENIEDILDYNHTFSGSIVPVDADIFIDGTLIETFNGNFTMRLITGTYEILGKKEGYKDFTTTMNISKDIRGYLIVLLGITEEVTIGPFRDSNGNNIPGISISFELDGRKYSGTTDDSGSVTFEIDFGSELADDTMITLDYNDDSKEKPFSWIKDNLDTYSDFVRQSSEGRDSLLIVGLLIIALIIIILVFLALRQRKHNKEEEEDYHDDIFAPDEWEDENEEPEEDTIVFQGEVEEEENAVSFTSGGPILSGDEEDEKPLSLHTGGPKDDNTLALPQGREGDDESDDELFLEEDEDWM